MSPADFVAHEARLLDERRHDEWLALFADDGRYWVPLQGAAQAEGAPHNALADSWVESGCTVSLMFSR